MIAAIPPDPHLPAVATLLDEAAIHGVVAGALTAAGSGRWSLVGLRPRYIRYKPGTRCLVRYDAVVQTGDGERLTIPAQIKIFTDDRAARRAGRTRLERLGRPAAADERRLDGPLTTYLPAVDGLLQLFPVDHDLSALATIANRETMTTAFRKR